LIFIFIYQGSQLIGASYSFDDEAYSLAFVEIGYAN
jgi:hypothetical protein